MWQDLVNGLFELSGSLFLWNNVRILYKHKKVRGVSVLTTAVFTAWGLWNLYYYPFLNQIMSFFGGLGIVLANAVWLWLALKYRRKDEN